MRGRLLFAVHRAYPYPGGSEYYVQNMAAEAAKRGYDVTVLAHEVKPLTPNLVKTTNEYQVLNESWDLIIVHGGDVITQNVVLLNSHLIGSPILYLIIKPSESNICMHGLKHADYLGYSTSIDINHIRKHGCLDRARRVRHGIPVTEIPEIGSHSRSSNRFNIMSAGGFSPHKGMKELAEGFSQYSTDSNIHLHLFGYMDEWNAPVETSNIHVHKNYDQEHVHKFLAYNADAYVMNSFEEGFGLVLLESMLYCVPWYARANVGAVNDLREYGNVYGSIQELMEMMKQNRRKDELSRLVDSQEFLMSNHRIEHTVDDIEDVLLERYR